ncbi:MAG: hypothetical protein IKL15_01775 [Mycoplasmataceae bacterium]|nr:hypothetical protein [Mycoplasmataceae bacterium]
MKKIIFCFLVFFISLNFFSQEVTLSQTDTEVEAQLDKSSEDLTIFANFITGSLYDKVDIIKSVSSDEVPQIFFEQSLEFALQNKDLIENHPAYYPLILSSIKKLNFNSSETTDDLLLKIYNDFSDYNLRLAILNAFSIIKIDNPNVSILVNDVVTQEFEKKDSSSVDFFVAGLKALENIKDINSFDLVFSCYKENISEEITKASCDTLYSLSPMYNDKIFNIVINNDLEDKALAFKIVTTNPKKDKNFSAEIASKLLFETINNIGEVSELSQEQIGLQLAAFKILEESKWTKETSLVLDFFDLAQKEYYELMISEDEFTSIIYALKEFPTTETCRALTDFLASQYSETLTTGSYNNDVMLAVISTLGELGDKDAFDTLLYVISCPDYSDEIITASRTALEKLKWKW